MKKIVATIFYLFSVLIAFPQAESPYQVNMEEGMKLFNSVEPDYIIVFQYFDKAFEWTNITEEKKRAGKFKD